MHLTNRSILTIYLKHMVLQMIAMASILIKMTILNHPGQTIMDLYLRSILTVLQMISMVSILIEMTILDHPG